MVLVPGRPTRVAVALLAALLLGACGSDPSPSPDAPDADATTAAVPLPAGDGLLALAALNPDLGTFVRAVEAAGLTEALSAEGPFTVFAPSDAAFAAAGDVDALLADPSLADRLRGHLIPTRMLAVDVFAPIGIETAAGTEIEVDASPEGTVTVRSGGTTTTVVTPDLDASNGVIHIIDAVL